MRAPEPRTNAPEIAHWGIAFSVLPDDSDLSALHDSQSSQPSKPER